MASNIRSRKINESKLTDVIENDKLFVKEKEMIGSIPPYTYTWNKPKDGTLTESGMNFYPIDDSMNMRSTGQHVGFKDPLVSYHEENDPLKTPDTDIGLLTPKDHLASTRNLNTSDVAKSLHWPTTYRNELTVTGVARTVTNYDAYSSANTLNLSAGVKDKVMNEANVPDVTLHLYEKSPRNDSLTSRSLHKQRVVDKMKQRRKLEENPDALAKLKETIQKQKENRSPSSTIESHSKNYHERDDTIISANYNPRHEQSASVRKIAAGPAAPTYKGFNAAETRLCTLDGKVWKEGDLFAKLDKSDGKRKFIKPVFHDRPSYLHKSHYANTGKAVSSKNSGMKKTQTKRKPVRKIGKIQTNHPVHKKSIITTSSWRENQLFSSTKSPQKLHERNSPVKDAKELDLSPIESESTPDTPVKTNEPTTIKEDDIDEAKINETDACEGKPEVLSVVAKSILSDLHLSSSSSESEHDENKCNKNKTNINVLDIKKRKIKKRPPLKEKSPEKQPEIPKIRHYDQVQVQQYMVKQKADRKRKQEEKKRMERQANEKRTKLLNDLDERQRKARKKCLSTEPGQSREKNSIEEAITDKPSDASPRGKQNKYNERIAAFMAKLEKINKSSADSSQDCSVIESEHGDTKVSQFMLKLGECIKDTNGEKPMSHQADLQQNSTFNDEYNDSISSPQHPQLQEAAQHKSARIAALRAKSESLQERISMSQKLLEQPGIGALLSERFSPKSLHRTSGFQPDVLSPHLAASIEYKSDVSKSDNDHELSLPGPDVHYTPPLNVEEEFENKTFSSLEESFGEHGRSPGLETWQIPDENMEVSFLPSTTKMPEERITGTKHDVSLTSILEKLSYKDAFPPSNVNSSSGIESNKNDEKLSPRLSYTKRYEEKLLNGKHDDDGEVTAPWKQGNGDKYSIMNIFAAKYLNTLKHKKNVPERPLSPVQVGTFSPPTSQHDKHNHVHSKEYVREVITTQPAVGTIKELPNTSSSLHASLNPGRLIKWTETLGTNKETIQEDIPLENSESFTSTSEFDQPYVPPVAHRLQQSSVRFSPAVLEQKMALELNRYDTIEEQMNQLAGSERTQGVAMAQQESVSLAQILQSRQLQHELEMERLTLKAKEEANEAGHKLQQYQIETAVKESIQKERLMEKKIRSPKMKDNVNNSSPVNFKDVKHFTDKSWLDNSSRSETTSCTFSKTNSPKTMPSSAKSYSSAGFDSYTETVSKLEDTSSDDHSPSSIVSERSTTSLQHTDDGDSIPEQIIKHVDGESATSSVEEALQNSDEDETISTSSSIKLVEKISGRKADKITEKTSSVAPADNTDNNVEFSDILTEDEIVEISRRAIIPSESHRRHHHKKSTMVSFPNYLLNQSDMSVSSDDASPIHNKSGFSALDESVISSTSLFGDSDTSSFNRFMNDRVRQYMREQEVRSQHQSAMLKLREKAIKEKTEVELAWLELKKRQFRNKGEDDRMPPINKKKRAILLRLQVETEEIKKLRAANKAASQDRELMIKQQQDINRIMSTTQHFKDKLKSHGAEIDLKSKLSISSDIPIKSSTPVPQVGEVSLVLESDDMSESDVNIASSSEAGKLLMKLKKALTGVDGRRLTTREKALLKRKKEAEKLLEWKRKLDEEEKKVYDMEQQALSAWKHIKEDKETSKDNDKKIDEEKSQHQASSIASSITEDIPTHDHTEGSISPMQDDSKPAFRVQDVSSEETIGEEYSQSFESTDPSVTKSEGGSKNNEKSNSTVESPAKIKKSNKTSSLTTKSDATTPLLAASKSSSSGISGPKRRESLESWSDESFSQTQSETEQSDVECRVHALKEELKRRQLIADRLKKQQKKKHKEHMRAQEASLKSQIEAYDVFIKNTQQELNLELDSPSYGAPPSILSHISVAKPQIRSPRKSEQNRHVTRSLRSTVSSISSPDASPRAGSQKPIVGSLATITKQRSDSESSGRSSRSLSFDEEQQSPEDATTPNGSNKTLLHALPSRHHDKHNILSTDAPTTIQDRPNKLDFANKSVRSMIPVPTKLAHTNKQQQSDKSEEKSQTSVTTSTKVEKPKTLIHKSPPSSYSEDFDKDVSIATEEEVSEHLSEISSDKSGASIPFMEVLDKTNIDVSDDDKTPVASPMITPTASPPPTPTAELNNRLMFGAVDVSDGTISTPGGVVSQDIMELSNHAENKKSPKPDDAIHKVDEISDKLFGHLLKDSMESALLTHKSLVRTREANEDKKRRKNVDENEQVEHETDNKRQRHDEPKMTSSAKNLLQLMSQDYNETKVKADRVSDDMTKGLLDDTISMVLAIRKAHEKKNENVSDHKMPDHDNGSEVEDIVRNERDVEPTFVRPVSPIFGASQDTEEWFDDDFGLSSLRTNKVQENKIPDDKWSNEIDLDEIASTGIDVPQINFVVPYTYDDVMSLVDQAVDHFYMKHVTNELDVESEMTFNDYNTTLQSTDGLPELDKKANEVFRNSIFDLVHDLLCEAYGSNDEKLHGAPWNKVKRRRRPSFCRSIPKSKAELTVAIRDEISRLYNFHKSQTYLDPRLSLKWGTMKKKDNVDLLLIEELREEEAVWTDYDTDEVAVKMQLTETVFDLLLHDTINCLNRIESSHNANIST